MMTAEDELAPAPGGDLLSGAGWAPVAQPGRGRAPDERDLLKCRHVLSPFHGVLSWQLSLAPDLARERQCQAQDYGQGQEAAGQD
jgi:hypothetical protein